LVSEANQQDLRAVKSALGLLIQRLGEVINHESRHCIVDLPGELDEGSGNVVFPRLPRQVEGIDWDAMPSETRSGIKRHVAERLRLGCFYHFPDIDSHGPIDELQLIDECDVDRPENVLGELSGLGGLRS